MKSFGKLSCDKRWEGHEEFMKTVIETFEEAAPFAVVEMSKFTEPIRLGVLSTLKHPIDATRIDLYDRFYRSVHQIAKRVPMQQMNQLSV